MRGKGVPIVIKRLTNGITPAYAGKRPKDGTAKKADGDHPRLCGEKVEQRNIVIDIIGSPPPMRGKVIKIADFYGVSRITPAYAGKRLIMYIMCRRIRDHPRLCGEKLVALLRGFLFRGSPPPMRGKARRILCNALSNGITPAYAGKSCSSNHVFTHA